MYINQIDMRVAGCRTDGITDNSVALISCVTNQIILILNSCPINVKPIRNDSIVHIQLYVCN